ncbi:hypothetical protein NDU88_005642 [Pleurodeles waltl]|uniref:Uncharacterized protein n=1 Tax=Pleurodeles waltl TaxID=8319 RepID=A0AAV7M9X9_PLEWA|nr:hypothetical protein NDU88_005642 [Pleurodeles waltl]
MLRACNLSDIRVPACTIWSLDDTGVPVFLTLATRNNQPGTHGFLPAKHRPDLRGEVEVAVLVEVVRADRAVFCARHRMNLEEAVLRRAQRGTAESLGDCSREFQLQFWPLGSSAWC